MQSLSHVGRAMRGAMYHGAHRAQRARAHVSNSGSTARDQLANERTFLAYTRTGMSFIGAGIALWTAYCFGYNPDDSTSVHPSQITAAVGGFVFNGGVILSFAVYHYLTVQRALLEGKFILSKGGLFSVMGVVVLVTVASLADIYYTEMRAKGNTPELALHILEERRMKHRRATASKADDGTCTR